MNLVLLAPGEIADDGTATLDAPRARHVRDVLRAGVGTAIRVGLLDGPLGTATVEADGPALRLAGS